MTTDYNQELNDSTFKGTFNHHAYIYTHSDILQDNDKRRRGQAII